MSINNDISRLEEVKIRKLIVTKTLVGNGTTDSPARYIYQIWSETGKLVVTLDYEDVGYEAISAPFSDLVNVG